MPFLNSSYEKWGNLNPPQPHLTKVDIEDKNSFFQIKYDKFKELDFYEIFGNNRSITIEIGSGKGEFIATYSRFYPEKNFIGIELKDKRIMTTLKKLDIENNSNVRLLKLFVDSDIVKYIRPESIDELIIYHPDPWPKTRHHKHRLFQKSFLDSIYPILKIDGYIRISTDDLNYKDWIVRLFNERDDFESMYPEGYSMIVPDDHLWTYFDEIKSKEGYEPCFMLYKKKVSGL
ncbi:MAG: tRNA (guanosine(46)-N7)-methyltransferase TrmB [Candidatus Cloacimonetes bacterium]|nr:tRNA (guanosine(46)-N7)-methyltransferase TrmB [Candidatus Cloacimonadota bacterium]